MLKKLKKPATLRIKNTGIASSKGGNTMPFDINIPDGALLTDTVKRILEEEKNGVSFEIDDDFMAELEQMIKANDLEAIAHNKASLQ